MKAWMVAAAVAASMAAVAGGPAAASSQGPAASSSQITAQGSADSLRVFLATLGPGAAVWERFGHNAIWIHDPVDGTDIAYHYGLFDMSEAGFLLHFLQGRMFYSMGDADAPLLLDFYRQQGREGTIQELGLTQAEIRELQAFLEWNMLPENRVYRYDYFRDNCSTRVRDALARVLDGSIERALRSEDTPITYRSESLSLTARDPLLTAGLDLGLGPLSDQPLTRWELAFIPMRLRDDVRNLTVERDGVTVPLVVSEQQFPPLSDPDAAMAVRTGRLDIRIAWMLLAGLALAGVVVGLAVLGDRRRGAVSARGAGGGRVARIGLGAVGALWGLAGGVMGLTLLGLWLFTDHEFAHRNENLLQANPLALALVVLVPLAVAGRATKAARLVAGVLLALSLLGLLLHPLPVTPQANLGIIALALPVHAAILYAMGRQGPD